MRIWICFLASMIFCGDVCGQESAEQIRLNQLGFYPGGPKIAVVLTDRLCPYTVEEVKSGKVVFKGNSSLPVVSPLSGRSYSSVQFSNLKTPGTYLLRVNGIGKSYPFEIRQNVHHELAKASLKNYYFQRLSIPLEEKYAGKWKRPAGHPDDVVLVHESAASASRPSGKQISAPRGWYDAGDYNKYIVNSGITMGTLLSAYEDFPGYYDSLVLNIPESGNAIPDLLDELLWNLRWMLAMQDPGDGGVYHKLTNARFDGMVMPDKAVSPRFVVQKSTAAALDFAAVTAQASRVFASFDRRLPGLADSCLRAARSAYAWAEKNPGVQYEQDKMNKSFDPDVVTGAYGDRKLSDEFFWASVELYLATKEGVYLAGLKKYDNSTMSVPGWNDVRMCGYYSLMRFEEKVPGDVRVLVQEMKKSFLNFAGTLAAKREGNPFNCPMGKDAKDFVWGSSAVAANQAMVLLNAYMISGDKVYFETALHNLDYLLGRNGTGYSFVTGYGDKTPMHPHHRPSEADGIKEPVPGMLSGGPNPAMQDKCQYKSTFADEAFVDDVCSYASNEIAINWNAPLVYVSGAIEALMISGKYSGAGE